MENRDLSITFEKLLSREDYGLKINHKKVYRLCKELRILRLQRIVKRNHPKRIARRDAVSGPNQLWEMDVKYGYIAGTDSFFFQLSLIDVFDRCVIDYHLGTSCTASDAARVLKNALRKRGLRDGLVIPKPRTDNGPQFIARQFEEVCSTLGITHESPMPGIARHHRKDENAVTTNATLRTG